jgi:imidazolonepropionase-like amidohydrolase
MPHQTRIRRLASVLALAVASPAHGAPAQAAPPRAANLLIEDVTLIDGTNRAPQPHMFILIANGRLVKIGTAAQVRAPAAELTRVNGTGKFVIPGLWDMHTHTLRPERRDVFLPLMIANGVTGTRDMGAGDLTLRDAWRTEIAAGRLVGPRIVGTGAVLDGPLPMLPGSYMAGTATEAADAVQKIKASGADFVKVYSLLPEPALAGAIAAARQAGLPVTGHLSEYVDAGAASDLGQRSFEHLLGVLVSISHDETALRGRIIDATKVRDRDAFAEARVAAYVAASRSIDTVKARALFRRLAANATWQVPTFTYWRGLVATVSAGSAADSAARFLPPAVVRGWREQGTARAERVASYQAILDTYLWIAREMRGAGVRFLAGTDALAAWCTPGFALHDELSELVAVGFTPLEAIQAATRNAAEFMGSLDSLGTVEAGKVADLVMLDASPLVDIHNTRKIAVVVAAGRLYDRRAVDGILAGVLAGAARRP